MHRPSYVREFILWYRWACLITEEEKMVYSINGQLAVHWVGGGMDRCVQETVFNSCLCGEGWRCFDDMATYTNRHIHREFCKGTAGSACSGHCNFCDLESFLFNSGLWEREKVLGQSVNPVSKRNDTTNTLKFCPSPTPVPSPWRRPFLGMVDCVCHAGWVWCSVLVLMALSGPRYPPLVSVPYFAKS